MIKLWLKRKRYWLEKFITKGTVSIIGLLTVITVIVSVFFGLVLIITDVVPTHDSKDFNFIEAFWQSFLHTIDTGAIQGDAIWGYRIIALLLTLIGVFIFSALIGVLTNGLDEFFVEIRKGKAELFEKEGSYTLILGWNPTIFKVLSELVLANANHKNKKIVILAPKDKIEMEDEIKMKVDQKNLFKEVYMNKSGFNNRTEIICRSGSIIDLDELAIVKPEHAKSIIIMPIHEDGYSSFDIADLSPSKDNLSENEHKISDATVIKCVLAIDSRIKTHNKADLEAKIQYTLDDSNPINPRLQKKNDYKQRKIHLISELYNMENIKAILQKPTEFEDIYIPSKKWLAKITAQTSRQSGYSLVLTELLNFETNEIYINKAPKSLVGQKFTTAVMNCDNGILIGIIPNDDIDKLREEETKDVRKTYLNPLNKNTHQHYIKENDYFVMLQEDDFAEISVKKIIEPFDVDCITVKNQGNSKNKVLFLGWNEKGKSIIKELKDYLNPNSTIKILADNPPKINTKQFPNIDIQPQKGDSTDFDELEKLNVYDFESIIVLGYGNETNVQLKDAKTILTLLHLSTIKNKLKEVNKDVAIVAEIYDDRNRKIVESTHVCDYIISDTIICSMMAQLSEQPKLLDIYEELFDSNGCEIYLKDLRDYLTDFNKEYTFDDLQKIALSRNQIAIGYRIANQRENIAKNYGMFINPQNRTELRCFQHEDEIIVISEGDKPETAS